MQALHSHSALFWAPRECRGEVANSDFVPRTWRWGPLRMQGLRSDSSLFWARDKVGVRYPILIFSLHLALGTPENAGVT